MPYLCSVLACLPYVKHYNDHSKIRCENYQKKIQ